MPATEGRGVAGLVLAGGRSTRMGGRDKGSIDLCGIALADRVLERLRPQVAVIGLNAAAGGTVPGNTVLVPDTIQGQPGPLAGIAAGLGWARTISGIDHLATAACDTPFLPADLVDRLTNAASGSRIAMARTVSGLHPTFALWPLDLAGDIERHLAGGGSRRLLDYAKTHGMVAVEFDASPFDPFFNVNTPDDLVEAVRMVREHGA